MRRKLISNHKSKKLSESIDERTTGAARRKQERKMKGNKLLKPSPLSLTFSDPLGRSFEGHPRGNFTDYCNFCFNLGEQYLKQYMLKK